MTDSLSDRLNETDGDQRLQNVGSVVLYGGQSERMGFPKEQLWYDGQSFLQRVIERVHCVTGPIVCVGPYGTSPPDEAKSLPSETIWTTDERPDLGPLEGIRVGLKALADRVTSAFVTSCDVPNLQPALIRRLAALQVDYEAVIPTRSGRLYGMTAIYQTQLHSRIDQLLSESKRQRRVSRLPDIATTLSVPVESLTTVDPNLDSLANINTPEQYFELLRNAGLQCPPDLRQRL